MVPIHKIRGGGAGLSFSTLSPRSIRGVTPPLSLIAAFGRGTSSRSRSMSGPNGDPHLSLAGGEEDEGGNDGGFGEAEYAAINSMLDQINSCLDHLEERNDHLHARLKELLESNRQTRLEFQQELSEGEEGEAGAWRPKPGT